MPTSTSIDNRRFANIGEVKVTFSDSTFEIRNINTLGETVFDTSGRTPVQIDALGQQFAISALPAPISYPSGPTGLITGPDTNTRMFFDQELKD